MLCQRHPLTDELLIWIIPGRDSLELGFPGAPQLAAVASVGLGQKPEPWYLKAGDTVRLGIEKLGEQGQTFVAWSR